MCICFECCGTICHFYISGCQVDMYINNTKVGTPEFAQTDNDNTVWNTALMSVSLRKGANTFELKANSSGAGDLYLDNIVIERK